MEDVYGVIPEISWNTDESPVLSNKMLKVFQSHLKSKVTIAYNQAISPGYRQCCLDSEGSLSFARFCLGSSTFTGDGDKGVRDNVDATEKLVSN